MSVVARFYVAEITRRSYDPGAVQVTMQAVGRGEENKHWAQATPSGQVTMSIKNSDASKFFDDRLGKDVMLTFTEVEDDTLHQTPYSP